MSKEYIDAALDEIIRLVGIKENISIETILEPLRKNQLLDCVKTVAKHLGLPCKFDIIVNDEFLRKRLVLNPNASTGTSSVTAQVHIPRDLPLYGTSKMQDFPIRITIRGDCVRNHETFVAILVHELSHVILHSLWYSKKDSEIYTDLVAMVLGFSEIIRKGRKKVVTKQANSSSVTTTTTTYGYLTDVLFDFAFHKVQATLRTEKRLHVALQEELICKIALCSRQLALWKKQVLLLKELVNDIDRNSLRRIRKEHVKRIIEIHELNFFDTAESIISDKDRELRKIVDNSINAARETKHYTLQEKTCLNTYLKKLETLSSYLLEELSKLESDMNILRRYC